MSPESISSPSAQPSLDLAAEKSTADPGRTWLPLGIAAAVAIAVVVAVLLLTGHRKPVPATAVNATPDAYAANLPLTALAMSESANLAGGKVTYLDGHIANRGSQTVTGITVQVIFRNYEHKVAQNSTIPLTLIRMREPYIDTETVARAPLAPGAEHDFRLIFDSVSPDWAGETPEVRVLQVQSK